MKKTIWFHIGTPKSGTTSIQNFMKINAEILPKYNLEYPIPHNQPELGGNLKNMILDFSQNTLNYYPYEKVKKYWLEIFVPIINSSNTENILFSAEALTYINPDFYEWVASQGYQVKIIAYVRPPFQLALSIWAELTKSDFNFNIGDFPDKTVLEQCNNCYRIVLYLIDRFGKNSVIIKPYEKEQWLNNNLIEDFLDIFKIKMSDEFIKTKFMNSSPDRNKLELIRIKNALNLPYEKNCEYRDKILNANSLPSEQLLPETIPDNLIQEVVLKFTDKINQIASACNKERFFLNNYPESYGKERPKFDRINVSLEELEILHSLFL